MRLGLFTTALGVAALAAGGPAEARAAATVHVTAREFSFAVSPARPKHGRITFVIVNRGRMSHDFSIGGHTSQLIPPGKTGRLTVMLAPGRHPYRCTIDGHAQLGMKGVLRVG
jgi:plastocyanin